MTQQGLWPIPMANQLSSYAILHTLPEQSYDDITLVAAQICDTPVAIICFAHSDRLWFKSVLGPPISEIALDDSFCVWLLHYPNEVLHVADLAEDEQFYNNPFLADNPHIRFYAGAPLVTPEGAAIGTVLARQVITQLELRGMITRLTEAELEVEQYQFQRKSVRVHDLVWRYGGEEFAVVLPNTTREEACVLAERIRQAVAMLPDTHRAITVSIGIASVNENLQNGAALIPAADQRLYHAKRQGRNQVSMNNTYLLRRSGRLALV